MRGDYRTKQKDAIGRYLAQLDGQHVTAAQIAHHFQESGSSISVSTVYRRLESLVQCGQVHKFAPDSGSGACYQYIGCKNHLENHYHFKCKLCGKLLHIQCSDLDRLQSHISQAHSFDLDTSDMVFWGICGACRGDVS